MRKTLLLLFLFVTVLMFGCSKKDSGTPSSSGTSAIVGKWVPGSALTIYYNGNTEVYRSTTNSYIGVYYYVFKDSGIIQIFEYHSNINGFAEYSDGTSNYSWNFPDSKTLIINQKGITTTYQYAVVDSNTMTLTENYTLAAGDQSANHNATRYTTATTYTRQ
ncbi:hypothetical protein ACFGVR_22680 [Mucilaginibacter sp. AW1-3]